MATGLGALANIAAVYSDSELETDTEEEEIVEYEKDEDFIKESIVGLVIKESVRRVEYAKSINWPLINHLQYRNKYLCILSELPMCF